MFSSTVNAVTVPDPISSNLGSKSLDVVAELVLCFQDLFLILSPGDPCNIRLSILGRQCSLAVLYLWRNSVTLGQKFKISSHLLDDSFFNFFYQPIKNVCCNHPSKVWMEDIGGHCTLVASSAAAAKQEHSTHGSKFGQSSLNRPNCDPSMASFSC